MKIGVLRIDLYPHLQVRYVGGLISYLEQGSPEIAGFSEGGCVLISQEKWSQPPDAERVGTDAS